MRRTRRFIFLVVLFLAAALLLTQLVLPPAVEERLGTAIARLVPDHERLTVQVRTFPALRLTQGRIDRVGIDLFRPEVEGVDFAWLALRGEGVQVDVSALFDRRLHVRSAESLLIEAAMGEEQLTAYVQSQLPQVSQVDVELLPGAVMVRGGTIVLGRPIQAVAHGSLEPTGTMGVRFVPHEIAIEGVSLPDALVQAVGALLEWHLDLSFLPFTLHIQSIEVADGYVVATGAWVAGE